MLSISLLMLLLMLLLLLFAVHFENGHRNSGRHVVPLGQEVRPPRFGGAQLHGGRGSDGQDRRLWHDARHLRDRLLPQRRQGPPTRALDGARISSRRRLHVSVRRVELRRRSLGNGHTGFPALPGARLSLSLSLSHSHSHSHSHSLT